MSTMAMDGFGEPAQSPKHCVRVKTHDTKTDHGRRLPTPC